MSDNHAVHFTNSLMSHVQRTAHMATLFRATATGGLPPRAASYARPAEVPSMLRPNMPAVGIPGNRSENAPGDLTGDVARGVTGDMAVPVNLSAAAASDWQAALRTLIGAADAAPIHDSPMAAPAAAKARAHIPSADRSSHLLAGTLRPATAVVAAAAQTAQAAQTTQIDAVRPHAAAPADGLASGYALQLGANMPGGIVQRAGLPRVDPLPGQPASEDIDGDATWRRLRAIVQAHNAALHPAASASPATTAARQAPREGLLTAAKLVRADSALPGGPGAPAKFEAVVEPPAPHLEQPFSPSAPLQQAPEAGTTLAGLGPQAASGPQELFGQVEDLYARAQDEWQGLPEKSVDRFTFAPPETDLQAVPLQAAWPVDQAALADADVPGMPQAGAPAAISAFLSQPSMAESLQAALAPIATGQPTSSPVDIVTPRRLRPGALSYPEQRAPAADAEPVTQALERLHTLQQHSENDRPLSAAFAAPPAVPPAPTPLIAGENSPTPPADLWRLIGLEPPAAAGAPSSQLAGSARTEGQVLQAAPAPQPDRQPFGAQPTGDSHGTAGSTAYVAGGTGRNAERVSGAGLTPASDWQKQQPGAGLDLDLLAHAVYARLHRRLLADQEWLHLR